MILEENKWTEVGVVADFFRDMGSCVKVKGQQIAVFNLGNQKWYAIENLCPHKKQMVLSRGILGSEEGGAKVSCPLHKRNFSLEDGSCLNDENCSSVQTYPIKEKNEKIFIFVE